MSKLSLFVDQHTPLRNYQPTASRVSLGAGNSTLWALGKRLSVWALPTALYQGATLALLQEGIDSAVIAAFEACSPKNFGHKEDPLLSQVIRIAIITALSSGVIVLMSRAVAQTPFLNRTAFLLPPFSQSFGGMAFVVASSHLLQAAGQYLVQQPVKKSEEEPKITTTPRLNIEADAEKGPTVKKKTTAELLPHSHRGHIQDFLRLKKWDQLSELYNKQRENGAIYELDPEFWNAVKHIVKLHDFLKLESFRCDSLSEYSLAYEALEQFGFLVESAAMRNRSVCSFLQPSIEFFIAKIKPQIEKLGNEYLNLACQKIIEAIDSYEKLTTILKDAKEHVIIRRSLTNTMEEFEIHNNDQIEKIKIKRISDRWRMDHGELLRKDNKMQEKIVEIQCQDREQVKKWVNNYREELRALFQFINSDLQFDEETFNASDSEKYQAIEGLLTQYHNKKQDRKEILSNLKEVCASS